MPRVEMLTGAARNVRGGEGKRLGRVICALLPRRTETQRKQGAKRIRLPERTTPLGMSQHMSVRKIDWQAGNMSCPSQA